MFFGDDSGLIVLTGAEVVSYGSVVDNTLLMHFFLHGGLLARSKYVLVVPIGLTLRSRYLPPQMHMILAQNLRYQKLRRN